MIDAYLMNTKFSEAFNMVVIIILNLFEVVDYTSSYIKVKLKTIAIEHIKV